MSSITRRGVLAAAGTLAAVAVARKPHAEELLDMSALKPVEPLAPLPEASFFDADGNAHGLAEFRGKGIVLNLWATWCVPCVAEMPALDALAGSLAGSDIVVIPISSDRGGKTVVERFYKEHEVAHLPIWLDPKGAAGRAWGARGLPTTYVIDREGNVRAKLEGGADWSRAGETIRKVIEG